MRGPHTVVAAVLLAMSVSSTAVADVDVRESFGGLGYEIAPASGPIEHRFRLDAGGALTCWDLSTPWLNFALETALVVNLHNTIGDPAVDDSATQLGGHLALYPLGVGFGDEGVGAVLRFGGALDGMGRHRPRAFELPSRVDLYLPASVVVTSTITWLRSEGSDPFSRVDLVVAVPLRPPRATRYRPPAFGGWNYRSVESPGDRGLVLRLTGSINRDDLFIGVQLGFGGVHE